MKAPLLGACLGIAALALTGPLVGDDARTQAEIRVDVGKASGKVSKYLTGACIEDVNHEIYGGIYSQMLFGESFQEAPFQQPLEGFTAYEGAWTLKGDELEGGAGAGPKLISDHQPLAKAEVEVEVFFSDKAEGNAGLIVKTHKPGPGADNFDGYEISLNPSARVLTIGRHRHNWEPIKDVPCEVPVGEWIRLMVKMTERTLDVHVNGKPMFSYEDRDHPLTTGGFGLRQWQRTARYRKLIVHTGKKSQPVQFQRNPDDGGPISGMWRPVRGAGAEAHYALDRAKPFIGLQSQVIALEKGSEAGIENQGLNRWGLSFQSGKEYEGWVWARAEKPVELFAGIESRNGAKHYAEARLAVQGNDWQRLAFTLTPSASDDAGRFSFTLKSPGRVELGYAFLQPGPWGRYKDLPVRRDVTEGLRDMGVTVLRYGGSMVNAPEYRWKKMIGPRDRRPPYKGLWYPHSSNGWGIIDFLDLCEAAGFLPIPAFNMDESPRDMADFVEYVNGPASSPWGKKRAADGHPAPYRLRHIELGNEERVDDRYWERFRAIAEAAWKVDRDLILVVGDFVYGRPITDPNRITGAASGITNLSAHRRILELAREHQREVWFDIHVGTENPGALGEVAVVPTYVEALSLLSGGANHKVVIFELNSGNHAQRRALANAIAIGELQQLGDRLPVICSANGLQPDGQNDNGWDQGLLFLNPSQTWFQPPGYVCRMISRSYRPVNVPVEVKGERAGKLKASAARSEDGKSLVLRVVNAGQEPVTSSLTIAGFTLAKADALVEELAGSPDDKNTAAEPQRIVPRTRSLRHGSTYTFPPGTFTVITLSEG